jgi:DNA-binding response OmpR family regulator
MRVLVIEDARTLAGFIEQSLHADGYAVAVCHDGPSGEAAALTGDYALVLLDLTLPSPTLCWRSPPQTPRLVAEGRP